MTAFGRNATLSEHMQFGSPPNNGLQGDAPRAARA